MRKAFVLAAGLAVLATSAWSQGAPRDRDDDMSGWHGGRGGPSRDWEDDRGGSMHDGRGMRGEAFGGRGARFFVRSGDARVGVICDPRDSTRACVDSALTLFDRVRQGATSGAATPTPPSPTPGPSPR